MRKFLVPILAAAVLAAAGSASAATVYSNFDPTASVAGISSWTLLNSSNGSLYESFAVSFTPTANYTLDSVTIPLHLPFSDSDGTVDLQLTQDNAGAPGTLVEDLGTQVATNPAALATYTSTGSTLIANTTYWLVAIPATPGGTFTYTQVAWLTTSDYGVKGNFSKQDSIGGSWFAEPNNLTPAFDVEGTPAQAAAAPLPSAAWMGLALLPLAALFERRRRRA